MNFEEDSSLSENRWLNASVHLWDGKTMKSALMRTSSPDDWYIKIHWALVDGWVMPVGIEVRSARTSSTTTDVNGVLHMSSGGDWGKGSPWPGTDSLKEVNRDLFKRLPVGQAIREGREQVTALWDVLNEQRPTPEGDRVARALARIDKSNSRSDWKFRETAKTYAAAWDDPRTDRNKIALETWKRLQGVPGLEKITHPRTRKNITEARRRGYLPATDEEPTSPSSSNNHSSPEEQ